jgi:hypothetical protein
MEGSVQSRTTANDFHRHPEDLDVEDEDDEKK